MGRIDDVCEKIVDKGAFGALLEVANKQVGSGESTSLKATQALSVRTISYLAVNGPCARRARRRVASSVRPTDNPPSCLRCRGGCACALDCGGDIGACGAGGGADRNQTRFLEDRQGNLRALTELLFVADNEDVRKYAAKTLAYLSLRNDKLKAGLLSGKGVQALIEALQGGSSAETLSHVACTIANLATNSTDRAAPHNRSTVAPNCPSGSRGPARARAHARTHADESQELLVQDARLFPALCALVENPAERADILRHVARGLANFALYGERHAHPGGGAVTTRRPLTRDRSRAACAVAPSERGRQQQVGAGAGRAAGPPQAWRVHRGRGALRVVGRRRPIPGILT